MRRFLCTITAAFLLLNSCKKTEELAVLPLHDYYPLQVGKYITYNLDSTVFYTNFNTVAVVKSYQVKHVVDAQITDAQGRPAYRILRYIRNNASAPWVADNTFMAVNTGNSVEFVENNLRFIKLVSPIRQDYTWQGNKYINTTINVTPSTTLQYLEGWDYTYDSINVKSTIGSLSVDSTIKVAHIDNQTSIDRTFSEEKYAKGIGLVYRNFIYWNTGTAAGSGVYADNSYGVVMRMIDHN